MTFSIIKRDGTIENYKASKIGDAVNAAFASIGEVCPTEALETLIAAIEKELEGIAENGSVRGLLSPGTPLYSLSRGAR